MVGIREGEDKIESSERGVKSEYSSVDCPEEVPLPAFEHHIFICTNTRPAGHPRGCCNPDGGARLRERFKEEVKRLDLRARVRANAAGCLDQCEHGPNVVVYPEGVWYGNVKLEDVTEILISHVVEGRPVRRLMLEPGCINTRSCAHKPRRGGGEPPA